ncbi:MAG: NADH-quinone oxidoreductase subunit, partial [Solirubrobacterales bacterium]|nr:NADH-quinone oxidoreductase subunit [Solirubrobacterales bacterium]
YRFRARPWDIEDAGSVCTLCPSQCNVKFTVRDENVMRVNSRDNHDVDDGWLCDKGRFGYQMLAAEDRVVEPMVRGGDGTLSPVSWDEALKKIADGLKAAGSGAAALLGGGTSNEEGWLVQRIVRTSLGSQNVASSANPIDPALAGELARPELTARTPDIDFAGAILVAGSDPLNESPILDLRIRKAVRHGGAKLLVATERPSALDGGAHEATRYAPGEAGQFFSALAGALGADGFEANGTYANAAEALADELKGVQDPVIVWGERLWRSPGAVEALFAIAKTLGIDQRLGPGLLEIPESANGRGLREVGCIGDANAIRSGLASDDLDALLLFDSNPVRDYPQSADWQEALTKAKFVVAVSMFDDASTKFANVVLPLESHAEKEGVVTHPDGRLQRVRRGIEVPDGVREGWRWLGELSKMLGDDLKLESQPETFAAVAAAIPIYEGLSLDEIGGLGVRWQERRAASALANAVSTPRTPPTAAHGTPPGDGLLLGTYRDIWADDVTERNPSLKFLTVQQGLEISKKDAEELELQQGQRVTVSVNGDSVEARIAIRERMPRGAAFLIEGTSEGNANVLANGQPRRVEISPALTPGTPAGKAEEVAG